MRFNGLFDDVFQLDKLDKIGDPLNQLNEVVDWEMFRPLLEKACKRRYDKGQGGRPGYDLVLLFKMLIIQRLYNLSDEQLEYQTIDRTSFKRFLNLALGDRVPDAKTVWRFREQLHGAGVAEEIFNTYRVYLEEQDIITKRGTIVDATFIDRRRQNMSKEEYEQVKAGRVPERISEKEARRRQIDLDARMGFKREKGHDKRKQCHNGYKDVHLVDAESKCITKVKVMPANMRDDAQLEEMVKEGEVQVLYGDKLFDNPKKLEQLPKGVKIEVHKKGVRNHPISAEDEERNRQKSKIRVRVEHVFASIKANMKCGLLRCVGIGRAVLQIMLISLIYNMKRYAYLLTEKREMQQATIG